VFCFGGIRKSGKYGAGGMTEMLSAVATILIGPEKLGRRFFTGGTKPVILSRLMSLSDVAGQGLYEKYQIRRLK